MCVYVYTHTHPTSLGLTDLVRNHRLSWVRDCSEGREVLVQSTSVTPAVFALQIQCLGSDFLCLEPCS